MPTPPLPTDDNVAHPSSSTGLHEVSLEERHSCAETDVQEHTGKIGIGQNLSLNSSRMVPGSDALSTEDPPIGFD